MGCGCSWQQPISWCRLPDFLTPEIFVFPKGNSSSDHECSGAMLVSGRVLFPCCFPNPLIAVEYSHYIMMQHSKSLTYNPKNDDFQIFPTHISFPRSSCSGVTNCQGPENPARLRAQLMFWHPTVQVNTFNMPSNWWFQSNWTHFEHLQVDTMWSQFGSIHSPKNGGDI